MRRLFRYRPAHLVEPQTLELISYLCCLTGAAGCLVYLTRGSGVRRVWVSVVAFAQGGLLLLTGRPEPGSPPPGLPQQRPSAGYVTSNACQRCHPGPYATWHDSYHRSMTQVASPETVRAPWDHVQLEWQQRSYELYQKGQEFWVSMPDPDLLARSEASQRSIPRVERRIVMTTGSHHYQGYWVTGKRGNELWQFPFVYHFESRRFIPRHDAFLQPPGAKPHLARWNSNCVQCHAVGGRPSHDVSSDTFATKVTELGVACEACHGPGEEHVRYHEDPVQRYRQHLEAKADPTIVHPGKLTAERSAQICGQCHAYFVPLSEGDWWDSGFSKTYQPGDALSDSRLVLRYETELERDDPLISATLESIFFRDGTIRVGGREYNGLVRSPCFERGRGEQKLSCVSCHQLHGNTPDDQLKPEGADGKSCYACHSDIAGAVEAHSHHRADSSGSNCYNCHMPYTTYALFKGIRSHRITSPNALTAQSKDTLNACNLCHLDRSLGWTADFLKKWYGQPRPELPMEDELLPHAVIGLLRGNAATRVLCAYSMGWPTAQNVSGTNWQAPLLAELLDDPYAAVRFVAHRSLRSLPGYTNFLYDFVGPPRERRAAREHALRLARGAPRKVEPAQVRTLIEQRDLTPISISE